MNLLEAKEILRKKGYTVCRLNECGGSVSSCGGSSSYSSGCGSSGCGGSVRGCGGSRSYSSGCGTISRSIRVGCGSSGYISNSCYSSGCGNYYYNDDEDEDEVEDEDKYEDETPKYIFSNGRKYIYAGYNSYYGCAEYTNSRLGKTILNIDLNHLSIKFTKIISLAKKFHVSYLRIVEIIEHLYKSGIKREITYNWLSKLDTLPEKLLRIPIEHAKYKFKNH